MTQQWDRAKDRKKEKTKDGRRVGGTIEKRNIKEILPEPDDCSRGVVRTYRQGRAMVKPFYK